MTESEFETAIRDATESFIQCVKLDSNEYQYEYEHELSDSQIDALAEIIHAPSYAARVAILCREFPTIAPRTLR